MTTSNRMEHEEILSESLIVAIGLVPLFMFSHAVVGRLFPNMDGDRRDLISVALSGFLFHTIVEEFDLNPKPRYAEFQASLRIPMNFQECDGRCGYREMGIPHDLMHN